MASRTISKICSAKDCRQKHYSLSLCVTHYRRHVKETNPICRIEGCSQRQYQKLTQLCVKHYRRLRANGDPLAVQVIRGDDATRFWAYVKKTETCWLWTGSEKRSNGYGQITLHGSNVLAHRYSYFLAKGKWPSLNCLHSCDVKLCVNPDHLRNGTQRENIDDMVSRNRQAKGERLYSAKLTEDQVREIRKCVANGEADIAIGGKYGIHPASVYGIRHNKTWRHVI